MIYRELLVELTGDLSASHRLLKKSQNRLELSEMSDYMFLLCQKRAHEGVKEAEYKIKELKELMTKANLQDEDKVDELLYELLMKR